MSVRREALECVITLGVVGESGSGVVKRVDDGEGHGTGETTGGDVGGELDGGSGVLAGREERLDLSLEGEVQSLGGEVSERSGLTTKEL
jgi:hypothetical protein